MILQLNSSYLDEIMSIIKDATNNMIERNIQQWDEVYPDEDTIREDLAQGWGFGYFDERNILSAYIALNDKFDEEYNSVNWNVNEGKHLIIHRLTVAPSKQGKGIAKECILFAEEFARKNKYSSIRLDAFLLNPIALNMYEKLEYTKTGIVKFRKGDFYCYEKRII